MQARASPLEALAGEVLEKVGELGDRLFVIIPSLDSVCLRLFSTMAWLRGSPPNKRNPALPLNFPN
jgi:hypothetical protein